MERELYIPAEDTYNMNFEYNGKKITKEEYYDMVWEHFKKYDKKVESFMFSWASRQGKHKGIIDKVDNRIDVSPDFVVRLYPAPTIIMHTDMYDFTDDEFDDLAKSKRGFIAILDIKEKKGEDYEMDYDAVSEIRFWKRDSKNILTDKELDDVTKIKALPKRDLFMRYGDKKIRFVNCKIIENYKAKKDSYRFAIMAEKIMN